MKSISIIIISICHIAVAGAQQKAYTERPDAFGRTLTRYYDENGNSIGKSYTERSDAFGRQKTTFYNSRGKTVGTASTEKPDSFGRRITRFFSRKKK